MASVNRQWQRWGRALTLAGLAAVIGWFPFVAGRPVPLLDWFDLAIHETGHLLAFALPDPVMYMAGSFAQIAFPLVVAAYFVWRGDLAAGGLCLAWAGTSAWDVSVYVADAPVQALPLVGGGGHDWAFILGNYDALDQAGRIAGIIDTAGAIAVLGGVALALLPLAGSAIEVRPRRAAPPREVVVREAESWPADPAGDPWLAGGMEQGSKR